MGKRQKIYKQLGIALGYQKVCRVLIHSDSFWNLSYHTSQKSTKKFNFGVLDIEVCQTLLQSFVHLHGCFEKNGMVIWSQKSCGQGWRAQVEPGRIDDQVESTLRSVTSLVNRLKHEENKNEKQRNSHCPAVLLIRSHSWHLVVSALNAFICERYWMMAADLI